ncbi:MAG: nucleotidyltransferase family protein [Candidatus Korarchaeota archaeon]|nr:nucleotidyltransferase family protein [Candidatus Korarchaeota archaeon]NIU84391.1 hypothetical protein [Candidatus Thorarchaeota archaeon]NIW14499.1 hypothetical protein [Candidatus Thorarchaeota archaeon]NIW52579.1 hypothetical protein [Candidatus Korarchaeota archaeon]
MSDILELINVIGLPGGRTPKHKTIIAPRKLLELARKNKVPLLFLKKINTLQREQTIYERRYTQFLQMLHFLATSFSRIGLHYTLIKTLKPFSYVPSDIDILVERKKDLRKAVSRLREAGLKVSDEGKNETTLFSEKYTLNVDLYLELNVIDFIYLNKAHLFKHTFPKKIHASEIWTLQPPAELVVVAAHALYKEQMFTLSEFYTFIAYLHHIEEGKTIASNTRTQIAYNLMLHFVYELLKCLTTERQRSKEGRVSNRVLAEKLKLPQKVSFNLLLKAFWEKIFDKYAFVTFFEGLKHLLTPNFYKNLISHTYRETY